jgi:hypothetical protein
VAGSVADAHERLAPQVTADLLDEVAGQVPDAWLEQAPGLDSPGAVRAAYREHLLARVGSTTWLPGGAG